MNTHWLVQAGSPDQYHYLYHNNGDGTYTKENKLQVIGGGREGYGSSCADYDNDGDIDILMVNFKGDPNYLYVNDGFGNFTIDGLSGISSVNAGSTSASWIDYDQNSILDLFISNSTDNNMLGYDPYPNFLYKDVGTISTKITTGEIVTDVKHTYSASWCDYDNDGDADLYTSSNSMDGNNLYRNNGDGSFTSMVNSVLSSDTGHCFGSSWGDYDNDGYMDLYVGNVNLWGNESGKPFLYHNNGDGTFTKILNHGLELDTAPVTAGVWGDYDNDGDLDIFIFPFNKDLPTNVNAYIFENIDGSTFTKVIDGVISSETQTVSTAVWGDYDRDGDLDLYTCRADPAYYNNPIYSKNRLYHNNGNGNNWITIKPLGTISNQSAIGTRVRVKANIGGSSIWQMGDVVSQTSARVQPPMEVHFGLGDAMIIDSIIVEWPSGIVQILENIIINQYVTITESCCVGMRGNIDSDSLDVVDISDLVFLVDFMFTGGPTPECLEEANVDGDAENVIDISDLVAFVDFMFTSGPSPAVCP